MKAGTMDPRMAESHEAHAHTGETTSHYARFAVMILLSFVAMYGFMYAMVDGFSSVYNNVNQVYMAGLMAAPMAIIEILLMRSMYTDTRLNSFILAIAIASMIFFWTGIRNQFGIGDVQFARSMIPHHSGAILMCEQARLSDPELKDLCSQIIESQRREVDQLKGILARLK